MHIILLFVQFYRMIYAHFKWFCAKHLIYAHFCGFCAVFAIVLCLCLNIGVMVETFFLFL